MDSIRTRDPANRPGYLPTAGSPSLKFVKLADNPKGANAPNPKVSREDSCWEKYMLPTGINFGRMDPWNPFSGTMVPGGVVSGKNRNRPTTTRLSISSRVPGWNAIPAGL